MLYGILVGVVLWLLIGLGQFKKKEPGQHIVVDQALFHLFFLVMLFGTMGLIAELGIQFINYLFG